jgi:hypothetical protein
VLTPKDLAELIVDALLRARLIKPDDVERAVEITAEEITVRKSIGDW